MIFTSLLTLFLAAVPVLGQTGPNQNLSSLVGTWSSGSKRVQTGPGFANPANQSFIYPLTTGVSFSFTGDGFFESARYRYNSNGSEPNCITGVIIWFHGEYDLLANGSIILTPAGDGYQQVQDPCAAVSNFVQDYNDTELYSIWEIFVDPTDGPKLHLFQADGTPLPPQFLVSSQPNMLPTQVLRNVTPPATTTDGLTTRNVLAINSASRTWSMAGAGGLATAVLGMAVASLFL